MSYPLQMILPVCNQQGGMCGHWETGLTFGILLTAWCLFNSYIDTTASMSLPHPAQLIRPSCRSQALLQQHLLRDFQNDGIDRRGVLPARCR
jgi:hypothetical protein